MLSLDIGRQQGNQWTRESQARARLEDLRRNVATLEGRRATTTVTIGMLNYEIDRRTIRSPVGGRIGDAAELHPGAYVREGDKLGAVVPAGEIEVVTEFLPAAALGRIRPGQHARVRVLIEGSSGGGKSTLGGVLAGLREPESGLLLFDGLDQKTLGREGWRRRVVAAPQFHENHVFASTFAFNLLMGRAWPPAPADLALAETICRELDLGPLLERMPAGLQQMVGETGWQLSHGERSRLFVARALLQEGEVVVLDESFAALDPRTLRRSMDCVLSRANALVMIAHP